MKILACGSRSWTNAEQIKRILAEYPADSLLIHGAARGADSLAALAGKALGMTVVAYPADWSKGRGAGFSRNIQMLDQQPDVVLAFWDGESKGTAHTITQAKRRSIPTRTFLPEQP